MSTDSSARSPGRDSLMLRDQLCDRFEAAWSEGKRPRLEDYLAEDCGCDPGEFFTDLLTIEIEFRRRLGERPAREEYEVRFPDLADRIRALFPGSGCVREVQDSRDTQPHARGTSGRTEWVKPALASAALQPVSQRLTVVDGPLGEGERDVPGPPIPSVAGYEMLGELGRGGMGVVYLARHLRLNRLCALKMISAGELADPAVSARFLAEATTVARLRHPHIVQIYHIGDHAGRPYFELEHVEGGSLASRLDGTPWPPADAARLAETLAHRDARSPPRRDRPPRSQAGQHPHDRGG